MKTILTGAAILLVGFGLMWWGRINQTAASAQNNGNPESSLVAPESLYDFGTISMSKGLMSRTFKIENRTDRDIYVPSISTSCMCTRAYLLTADGKKGPFGMPGMGYLPPANEMIKAGESREVEVVYDPAAHGPAGVGRIDRFVYITDRDGGTLQLEIKANVTP